MRRAIGIVLSITAVAGAAYYAASKWAVRHETMTFHDAARNRDIDVSIAVRRDKEFDAIAGVQQLPVAILNHGNTVKFTEYSFIANLFAMRGYMAVSIQHDLATDAPLVTKVGEKYVGREPVYVRGVQNIRFVVQKLHEKYPDADFHHLTMVGHSNGGDISMYFAQHHPDEVRKVVTLDNLRVPFITDGKFKILSFRSQDTQFKPDAGVVPDDHTCEQAGITLVNTKYQHTDMSDRGPEVVKNDIQASLDKFLSENSDLSPVKRSSKDANAILMQYTPVVN